MSTSHTIIQTDITWGDVAADARQAADAAAASIANVIETRTQALDLRRTLRRPWGLTSVQGWPDPDSPDQEQRRPEWDVELSPRVQDCLDSTSRQLVEFLETLDIIQARLTEHRQAAGIAAVRAAAHPADALALDVDPICPGCGSAWCTGCDQGRLAAERQPEQCQDCETDGVNCLAHPEPRGDGA